MDDIPSAGSGPTSVQLALILQRNPTQSLSKDRRFCEKNEISLKRCNLKLLTPVSMEECLEKELVKADVNQ